MSESDTRPTYEDVATQVAGPNPPQWLVRHFENWSSSIRLDKIVHQMQPKRAEIRRRLRALADAAALVKKEIDDEAIVGFLDDVPIGPMAAHSGQIDCWLGGLVERAEAAFVSPQLATEDGKTKPGRLKALPSTAFSPEIYCAALIAEAFLQVHGKEPSSKNPKAARAAESLWVASGNDRARWGNNPLTAWRHHFEKLSALGVCRQRQEIRRHLIEGAHHHRVIFGDESG